MPSPVKFTHTVIVTDGRPAPLEHCRYAVCRWITERDSELEKNYKRYLAGTLVFKDDRE